MTAALLFLPTAWSATPAPTPKEQKGDLRVITKTDRPAPQPRRQNLPPGEKETVAFLGVQASPASRTLSVQLGLPTGAGLVVNHVVPDSPAAGVLQEHDILLKLDDQILIETRQLSVLVRQRKEGDEVTLTYLRGGKEATARVKLGKQEVPKMSAAFEHRFPGGLNGVPLGPGRFEMLHPQGSREDVDRVLSLIRPEIPGGPSRIQIERPRGPGVRATSVHPSNSNIVYSDDEGSLELTMAEGRKTLVAKDASGQELYSGPVNTPEERSKLPPPVRERLEKLEAMHNVTFRTDENFRGAETRVFRPFGRGISVPAKPVAPMPQPRPQFF